MFDQSLFYATVKERGLTLGRIAIILSINPATLYRKINGMSDFSRGEIQALRAVLGLNITQMAAVFFA